MRTGRSNGSTAYSYVYNGSQLVYMTVDGNTLYIAYDALGVPSILTYNGTMYFYITNAQGDIVAIADRNHNLVVKYEYDAWGNILSTTGSMASTLGVHNPLRYRGYVYDTETGLYYLQSRYYNPYIGRFINADAYASTGQGFIGNNMFAYCLNNPVNYVDRGGARTEALQWWATAMGWLPFVDTALPIGDIIYVGGFLLLDVVTLTISQDADPKITFDRIDEWYDSPSPSDNNDDDDYDDDNNYGGYQPNGKHKGNAPRNNQAQNRQFRDATKGLSPKQRRLVHNEISGKGLGYHEIMIVAKDIPAFVVSYLAFLEWQQVYLED